VTRRTLSSLDLKQADVGLATAVLIDATVIHHVLLPTVTAVLGEGNWYRRGLTRQRGNGATGQRGNGKPIKIRAAGSGGEGPQPSECAAAGAADTTLSRPESGGDGNHGGFVRRVSIWRGAD